MNQVYDSSADFEALFARLFADIEESDPSGMDPLTKKRMIIRFQVSEPDADMWVDGRTKPVNVTFGTLDAKATLTAVLTGDTLHELLLGTLPLGKAVSGKRLKVKGSMFKARRLESLLHACQAAYPSLAEEMLGDT
jgi:putative sterol carrier protein